MLQLQGQRLDPFRALYLATLGGQPAVDHPARLPATGGLSRLSIRARLIGVMSIMALLLAVIAGSGLMALHYCNQALNVAYNEHMSPSLAIGKMVAAKQKKSEATH